MTFDLSRIGHFLSGKKKDQDSKPPLFLAFRSSTLFIGAAVCIAIFSDILLYGIIVPVVPYSLTVQVGIPEHEVQQWTAILLACYSGALFLGSPIAGVYADHTSSRRLPLLIGLLALTGSTIMLCLGKSIGVLIVGRILQGLSAAIVWSVGLALLVDTTGRNVGIAMGYVSIAMSVGLLIAPLIGGGVYAAAGYYAVFYIGFGFIALDFLLRFLLVE
jgi:MFS family permease